MKKLVCCFMVMAMLLSMTACGKNAGGDAKVDIADSMTLLNTVWATYGEDEKFAAGGGDFASEETTSMEGPAKFGITDAMVIDSMLGLPESELPKIDDAASLMHMMNANTFTCGAYRAKAGEDVTAIANALKSNIQSRQWICGCPDKLLVATLGNYVVAAFGEAEIMKDFQEKLIKVYPTITVVCDEPIS